MIKEHKNYNVVLSEDTIREIQNIKTWLRFACQKSNKICSNDISDEIAILWAIDKGIKCFKGRYVSVNQIMEKEGVKD